MKQGILAEQRVLKGMKWLEDPRARRYFELSYDELLLEVLNKFVCKADELKTESDKLKKELEEERGLRNKLIEELEKERTLRKAVKKKPWREFSPAMPFGEGAKKMGSETATIGDVVLHSPGRKIEEALVKAEEKLRKMSISGNVDDDNDDDDNDEITNTKTTFPNLKYAKPKYQNVESILRYVESKEDKGGVKLVIMNFND